MIRAFQSLLRDDTSLLQQICLDIGTGQFSRRSKVDTDEFTETRRVVVTDGLGVAERLQYRICLNDLILQRAFLLGWIVRFLGRGADGGEVRDYLLRVLGLPGSRLTGDQHGLILAVGKHVDVGSVGNGENVRRHLVTPFASIKFRASLGVYGESFVGVNSYTEEARVGVNKFGVVTLLQIVQDRSIVEIS